MKNIRWNQVKAVVASVALALVMTGCRANLGNFFDLF